MKINVDAIEVNRKLRCLSKQELADMTGMTRQNLFTIMKKTQRTSFKTLEKVAGALNVDAKDLLA